MGKYIRKRKGVGEIAAMEVAQVGVRKRSRSMAMAAEISAAEKRRNVRNGRELSFSSSLVQFMTPESSLSTADSSDPCFSASSDHVMDSCSSSNESTKKKRLDLVNVKDEYAEIETSSYNSDRRERRETKPSNELQAKSDDLESTTAPPSEANSRRILTVGKTPPKAELEEFFAIAEKTIRKQFTKKYNYDILKDVPLEGRYEWVKLNP